MPSNAPPEDAWRHLTIPEVEVLACLAEGLTEPQTAARLGVTIARVRNTVARLRRRTGLRRGADMGAWWAGYRARYAASVARAAGLDI